MQTSLLSMETRGSARKKMRLEKGKFLVVEDRLSNLPVFLIDKVVSQLPSRSVSCMPILSKKWEYLMNSFPGLLFDEQEFVYKNDKVNDRRFCQFMGKYTSCQIPMLIQTIRLGTSFCRRYNFNHQVDRCLDLALPSEIRELVLKLRNSHQLSQAQCHCYTVPGKVFSLGKNLSILELEGCRFGDLDSVNVSLLKRVSLSFVHLNDNQLYKLLVACPSLESFCLRHCYELKRFRIHNPSLKRLVVNSCRLLESFYVNCPLLQYLECRTTELCMSKEKNAEFSEFSFTCPALSEIHLAFINLGSEHFKGLFSASPQMKSVTMKSCGVEYTPNVFPRGLKHLSLEDTYLPQLLGGLYFAESFTFNNNINHDSFVPGINCHVGYGNLASTHMICCRLKSLSLGGAFPPSNVSLETIVSECHQLQNLSLSYCHHLTYLKITNMTLETLSITYSTNKQLQGEINAPSLISFDFEGPRILFSHVTASHQLEAELYFREYHDIPTPLKASELQHYLVVFRKARVLKLSNLLTECVFTAEKMKVSANLRKTSYKQFLLEVLSVRHCRTSLSMNFEKDMSHLFGNASASLELKFQDQHRQRLIILQGENHDCINDHLYEISVQIRKGGSQIIPLLKFLMAKALHLKKFVVQFSAEVPADNRSSMISKIAAQEMASKACEMVIC